jgi:hypothetical protein
VAGAAEAVGAGVFTGVGAGVGAEVALTGVAGGAGVLGAGGADVEAVRFLPDDR